MKNKTITLSNKLGLHARASTKLVNLADRFQSEILLKLNDRTIDAKDILQLMILGASCGTTVEIIANGDDEAEAVDAITQLIRDKFGESE